MPRKKEATQEELNDAYFRAGRLRALRDNEKLSLKQVAERTQLTVNHLWYLENARCIDPKLRTLRALAKLYGVRVAYLIGEE